MNDFPEFDPEVSTCEKINDPKKVEKFPISEVLKKIKNPPKEIIDLQDRYRKTGDSKYKKGLPAYMAAGVFTERKLSGFRYASGLMALDYDKFESPEEMQELRNRLIENPYVFAVFISPSGKGLKVLIRIRDWKDQNDYRHIHKEAGKTFHSKYFDSVTSDISRLTFFAYDPDIYVNMYADVFNPESLSSDPDLQAYERLKKWQNDRNEFFIEGNRNKYIFDIAGACCRLGIDKDKATDLILSDITLYSDFDTPEVKTAINSAYKGNDFGGGVEDFEKQERKKADAKYKELKEIKKNPFPIEVFPDLIQSITKDLNNTLNFPIDYAATAMLYTVSVSIGSSCKVKFQNGWYDIAACYFAIVGKAGTIKTHPLNFALKPLKERDSISYDEYMIKDAEYQYYNSLSKKEKEEEINPPTQVPAWQQFLVSDFTPEALVSVLNINEKGIGVYVDELASWFKNFNRYNNGSEEQFWLSAWNGTPITVNRKNGKNYHISDPFLSVIGTIQDSVLYELANNRTGNGFLDRILFAYPDDQDKKAWSEKQLNENVFIQWEAVVSKLLEFRETNDTVLEFTPEAKSYLMDWQRDLTEYLNKPENDNLKSIYAKLETYAIRFSLLMEVFYYACNESDLDCISLRSAKASTELIQYFFRTALKVYSTLSGGDLVKSLPLIKQRVFDALPDEFKISEGFHIAFNNEMTNRSFERFVNDEKLFQKIKRGLYRKVII